MIRISLIAAALVTVGSCGAHKIQYYQLSAIPAFPAPVPAGPVLLIGRIATPQGLQDGRIRYRVGANGVGAYEYHRWSDPPGLMVKESLIWVLRASRRYSAVQDATSSATGDLSLRGRLLEFAELDGQEIQTRVSLALELREVKSGRLVWNKVLTRDDPVGSKGDGKKVADVVASLDRNLRMVLEEASTAIGVYVVGLGSVRR